MPKVYRFCPFCAEKLTRKEIGGRKRRACAKCGFVDFENARPTAGAIILNEEGKVLLAKRAVQPLKGMWNVPGGFLEGDEHPFAGAVREIKEETGLEVEPIGEVGIYMDSYNDPKQGFFYTINIYVAVRVVSGAMQAEDDTAELKWFSLNRLPDLAFACDRKALVDYRKRRS